jgi:RimJ/RimL family protein N-acetyltransferase
MFVTKQLRQENWQDYRDIRVEAITLHEDKFSVPLATTLAQTPEGWQSRLGTADSAVFGLYNDNKIIGLNAIFKDSAQDRTAILAATYVQSTYRGRGLSRLILKAGIDWAKAHGGFDRIEIGHRKGNQALLKAIQAFDFKEVKQRDHTFGDGTQDVLLIYELRI